MILGLANPGAQYEGSRHNVGGDAVRLLAQRHHATLKLESRQRCLSATIVTDIGRVTLAVPTTFMNESGAALPPLFRRVSMEDPARLLVAHDELDLDPGRLRLKWAGGLAGHNGLKSIAGVLSTQDFWRLRIGIGKPPTKEQGADWVLRPPTGERRRDLVQTVEAAADALEQALSVPMDEAQRRVNAPTGE